MSRRPTVTSLVCVCAMVGANVAMLYVTGRLVGEVPDIIKHGWTPDFGWLLVATTAVFTLVQLLPAAWATVQLHVANVVRSSVQVQASGLMLKPLQLSHLENPAVQDEHARATGTVGYNLRDGVKSAQNMLYGWLSNVASAGLVAVLFSWWVALLTLVVLWWQERHQARRMRSENAVWHGESRRHREAAYHFELGMGSAAKDLRVFGLGPWLTERYGSQWEAAAAAMRPARRTATLKGLAVTGVVLLAFGGTILWVAREATAGRLAIADTTTVVGALIQLSLRSNSYDVAAATRGLKSYRALRRLPELITAHLPTSGTHDVPEVAHSPAPEIRFEKVCFRYPGQEHDALHGLDLTIKAGEALAVVGLNGAGKSTLMKLLLGGYRPTSGRVTVDGIDLASLTSRSLAHWQQRTAAIVQDFLRFPFSARENIALGLPDDEAVAASVRQAGAADLIDRLPLKWGTILDKSHEDGTDLSGGEWQRIALARALYAVRGGAKVLVLDEPAAALDVRGEAALVDRYLDLTSEVTSVIISHRFSVVRGVDRICVLEDGCIRESGSHEELLAAGGRYAAMFHAQADRYLLDSLDEGGVHDGT
ncbi:ABC transporter ATP-binding protein [Streptomyces decoyicus]